MANEAAHQQQSGRWRWPRFAHDRSWWLFCLGIIGLKLLLLLVDPSPRLYLSDSLSYIRTAISGWIPEDLPFLYGYVVRWLGNWPGSFTPLIVVQVLLGAGVSIIVAWTCRAILSLPERVSYLFGFLCSIDPLQLTWERYVIPESFSLFFYALVLQQSFIYLRRPRIVTLIVIQLLSIITIAFRMMYLLPLQVVAVGLPLIGFAFETKSIGSSSDEPAGRMQFFRRSIFWRHFAVSIIAMVFLGQAYRETTGLFAHREAAYLHGGGYFLLSTWAGTIRPEDSPDPRLAEIIRDGNAADLTNDASRQAQRVAPSELIKRWREVEPDKRKSASIATRTAINALLRDPAAIINHGAKTYYLFWKDSVMERRAQAELRTGNISENQQKTLEPYHWRGSTEPGTLLRWYYVAAAPYYFAILLVPLLFFVLLFFAPDKAYIVLLFAHTVLIFIVTLMVSAALVTRYLQPMSLLTLLGAALAVKSLFPVAGKASASTGISSRWRWRGVSSRRLFAGCALLAAAAIMRTGLAGNQPLWNDEVFSLAMATGHSLEHPITVAKPALGDFVEPDHPISAQELRHYTEHDTPPAGPQRVFRAVFLSDTSPPLYYFLVYGWTLAFGTSDFVLRAFSTICSLACLPFIAGIARRTAGRKAIVPSCVLFAFSPMAICFSTEARMYSLLWLCVVTVTWLSLVWRANGGNVLLYAGWVATSAAGFLTHYFFIFPWTALVVFILLRPQKIARLRLIICILFTALIISPWYVRLPESMHNWRLTKVWLTSERDGFNRATAALHLISQNFSGAGHHESSNFVALVIFAVIAVAAAWRLRLHMFARGRLLLWLLFLAPCAGVLVFDLLMHSYTVAIDRYAIAALPFACLLAAAALASLTSGTRTLLLALILLAWAPNSLIYKKTGQRVTHRNRAEVVNARQRPTDLILIDGTPSGLLDVVRYLKGPAPIVGWTPHWIAEPGTERPPEWILEMAAGRTRIWWVAAAGAEPSPLEREWLCTHAVTVEQTTFVTEFRPKDSETF